VIVLRYQFPEKEELIYQIGIDSTKTILNSPNLDNINKVEHDSLEIKIRQQLQSIAPDGSYQIRMAVEPVRLLRDGQEEQGTGKLQTIDVKMSPFGDILWSSVPSPAAQPSYPSHPLEVGAEWEKDQSFLSPLNTDPLSLHLHYSLKDVEDFQERDCVKIEIRADEQSFSLANQVTQKMSLTGFNLFDHKKGCLVKSEIRLMIFLESPDERVSNEIITRVLLLKKDGKPVTA